MTSAQDNRNYRNLPVYSCWVSHSNPLTHWQCNYAAAAAASVAAASAAFVAAAFAAAASAAVAAVASAVVAAAASAVAAEALPSSPAGGPQQGEVRTGPWNMGQRSSPRPHQPAYSRQSCSLWVTTDSVSLS